jgi:predicted CoA-binding protein
MQNYSDDYIAGIMREARTFALVGASDNIVRPSHIVAKYLLNKGYEVVPINPGLAGKQILGRTVQARLADVPGPVDLVDVFRNSDAALEITRDAIRLKDKLGIKAIWMQIGVVNEQAAREAEAAGLKVVMNRCPKIEYGRLSGEIGWAGVNSGRITSQRPKLAPKGVQNQIIGDS